MCGRFALIEPIEKITDEYFIDSIETDAPPSYNIAPNQDILAVVEEDSKRKLVAFQWGLVPFWAKDTSIGNKMINARSETVDEKPSFRQAFKSRRCLIIASGFYEWDKRGPSKRPVYIFEPGRPVFAFSGLYERWSSPEGGELRTCTILTTGPNEKLKEIHNRMPVILARENETVWLADDADPGELKKILAPYPSEHMDYHYVSTMVNSPKNNSPECIKPVDNG